MLPCCYNQLMVQHKLAQRNKASQTESRLDLLEKIIEELVQAINKPYSSIEKINEKRDFETKQGSVFEESEVLTFNRSLTGFVVVLVIYWFLLYIPGLNHKGK